MNIEMFRLKIVKSVLSSSMVVKLIYRIRKKHSYERKLLKVHCESKEYTAWSDTAFCVVWPGSALFVYELPTNNSSACNLDTEQA